MCATQWTGELECARTGRRLCKCATQAGVQAGRQAGACEQACRQAGHASWEYSELGEIAVKGEKIRSRDSKIDLAVLRVIASCC